MKNRTMGVLWVAALVTASGVVASAPAGTPAQIRTADGPVAGSSAAATWSPEVVVTGSARATHARFVELAAADRYSGAVLVARSDEVLLRSGYGLASREFGVENTPSTRFILGSINKMFTAVAVLQLVERGDLALDDVVADHLPGVLRERIAERVTIAQLLTHTSGLGDFLFTPEMENVNRARYREIADYLPALADDRLDFDPGERWRYSNTGYLLLGAIIEAVTGDDYFAHITEHVLEPAGMMDTGWPELDRVPRNVASTYTPLLDDPAGGFISDRYEQVVKGTPAGGGFSTLEDMRRFARALADGHLLRPPTVALMLSPKPELNAERYGYGAQIFADGWVGHTGGGPGTADFFAFRPGTGEVVVIMGNLQGTRDDMLEVFNRARELASVSAAR